MPERSRASTKLSYKQQRALDELPGRIAGLEREIGELEAALADAALYARDQNAFQNKTARLAAARNELAQLEDEWLEMELLREELAGARRS
jgi:ATP-binding cassette subfamily F protein uup